MNVRYYCVKRLNSIRSWEQEGRKILKPHLRLFLLPMRKLWLLLCCVVTLFSAQLGNKYIQCFNMCCLISPSNSLSLAKLLATFEDSERSLLDLKLLFFRTVLDWMLVLRNHSICSVRDLIDLRNLSDWLYGS